MLLADMGADVIRVERRGGGEDRYLGPITPSRDGGLYLNLNRNKRSIALDLSHPMSAEVLRRLIGSADLVVANLPIDVMKSLGLDYDRLRSIKENIILVMASAFGPDGPYWHRVGFDSVAQAMSGAMSLTGFPDVPVRAVVPYVDYGTALHAAFGAMVALYERQRTGRGQLVDVSLLATGVTFMQPFLAEREVIGVLRAQQGNASFYAAPANTYRTRDGWITVQVIGNDMFRRWAELIGRPELAQDPRLKDDIARADARDLIDQQMIKWCGARTSAEAIAELERARIPCGPVLSLDEVLANEQVRALKLLERIEYPGSQKPIPLASTPLRLSLTPGSIRSRAPMLGEHTEEVLGELGFTSEEINALRRAGAI
jgi:crotonobetainyl-CoA:carnitine CoA-transferase CaiB-like acyl-CoA transferase